MSELEAGASPSADARTIGAAAAEFSLFVAEHYPRLVRLAGLICDQPADREDALQTALERAWRARDSLHEPDRLRVWLDRIVVREAIRLTSRIRRVRVRLIEPRRQEDPAEAHREIRDPRSNEPHEMVALRAAFDELPPSQRAVVVLHLYAGYSVQDTAELVNARVETVRSRLRLARARLRTQLEAGQS